MIERYVEYEHEGTVLEGYMAVDEAHTSPRPAVLVAHTWEGRSEFVCDKARILAGQGYVGFALDLYGRGVVGSGPEENGRLMQPFLDDRAFLQARLRSAFDVVRLQDEVDNRNIAAIGYCFGGLCVLDLARTCADVRGVVSFHGLLGKPGNTDGNAISAKVLILHGNDDPMAQVDDVVAIEKELTEAGADWQLHAYGNTVHAFTNPNANDPGFGTVYNTLADHRSWISLMNFLSEVLD